MAHQLTVWHCVPMDGESAPPIPGQPEGGRIVRSERWGLVVATAVLVVVFVVATAINLEAFTFAAFGGIVVTLVYLNIRKDHAVTAVLFAISAIIGIIVVVVAVTVSLDSSGDCGFMVPCGLGTVLVAFMIVIILMAPVSLALVIGALAPAPPDSPWAAKHYSTKKRRKLRLREERQRLTARNIRDL